MGLKTIVVCSLFLVGRADFVGAQTVEVAPGTIVRWPGSQIESCGLGESHWSPLPDGCWYPIDLLASSGPVRLARRRNGVLEEAAIQVGDYPYPVQRITLKDDSQVNLSAADLARVQKENRAIGRLWSSNTARRFEIPLAAPLDPLPASGRFGHRRYFNDQPRSPHSGADYAADAGAEVRAVAEGRVALTGDFFFPGKSVFIDHGDGLISMYFHLSEIGVVDDEQIRRGQPIGKVGQSGRATGPHLHFGIRWHGARIDPGLLIGPTTQVVALP
jgi:murein DD-endopeptidase MepM/ murein hydrolase activator NlpD